MKQGRLSMLLVALVLIGSVAHADPAALSAEELGAWRDSLWTAARGMTVENDPEGTNDPDMEDTWLYAFSFGVIVLSEPTLEAEANPIAEVELLTDEIACPRGLKVGDTLESVLAAYPNENPNLIGDSRYAALYTGAWDDTAGWGMVIRRNRTIEGVEYRVSQPAAGMDGFRQELAILYVLTEDVVSAIRIYGFDALIPAEESEANLAMAEAIAGSTSYVPAEATETAPLLAEDLSFGGVSFLGATPEGCIEAFGQPLEDRTESMNMLTVRTLTYPGMLLEFVDADGAWRLEACLVSEGDLEGPRGLRIGDSLAAIIETFGPDESEDDSVQYTASDAEGNRYALSCSFFEDSLIEYLLYRI